MSSFDLERMEKEYAKSDIQSELYSVRPIIPFLRDNVSPILTEKLASLSTFDNRTKIIRGIAGIREQNHISRPAACALFIRNRMYGVYEKAQEFLDQRQRGPFFVWFQLAESEADATLCIDRAEGVLRRGVREEILHAFEGEIPADVEEIEERFQKYSAMLTKDPTGVLLIKYQILRASEYLLNFPAGQHPYQDIYNPTHLLATMYTAALYKTIYPLSE